MSAAGPSSDGIAAILRQELKAWEKSFAAANAGRKAGRDDIKKDASIAAKYKEYDRLRPPSSQPGKARSQRPSPGPDHSSAPRPETRPEHVTATPQKASSHPIVRDQLSHALAQEEQDLEPTPAAIRMHLGPTPQKDGQILSLFDIHSSAGSATPSKRTNPSRFVLAAIEANIANTPSKPNASIAESPAARTSRTPASSGKRFLLDTFATPLKRKRSDEDDGDDDEGAAGAPGTPSSAKSHGLATPAFLRRSSNMLIMDTLVEEAEQEGDAGLARIRQPPFKRRGGLVRSLSTIIRGLRKQEDDRLDEEMDIMREMEDEGYAPVPVRKAETQQRAQQRQRQQQDDEEPDVLVEDSQIVMPLGPDRGFESDESEEDDVPGRDGRPRKPWKKKGLKRQTKRVIMRPVTHKSKPATAAPQQDAASDSDASADAVANGGHDTSAIPETQLQDSFMTPLDDDDGDDDGDNGDRSSGSESDFSASESQAQRKQQKQQQQQKQQKKQHNTTVTAMTRDAAVGGAKTMPKNDEADEGGAVKRVAKKIGASAHANFRKLKIKNQNSKAGGRRFGRR
ncbi:hypothetical protein MBLNU459_g2726t2 [Dothideomycetes sp. NU459]